MAAPETLPTPRRPKRLTRKEKQAETRRRLLDAGERVFLRRGLQGSSIEEIAAEAGYTKGAFYSNFKGKDELFVELLHARVYDRYAELAKESQEQPGTPASGCAGEPSSYGTCRRTSRGAGSSASGSRP